MKQKMQTAQIAQQQSDFALGQNIQNENQGLMWGIIGFHILHKTHQTKPNNWIN